MVAKVLVLLERQATLALQVLHATLQRLQALQSTLALQMLLALQATLALQELQARVQAL